MVTTKLKPAHIIGVSKSGRMMYKVKITCVDAINTKSIFETRKSGSF